MKVLDRDDEEETIVGPRIRKGEGRRDVGALDLEAEPLSGRSKDVLAKRDDHGALDGLGEGAGGRQGIARGPFDRDNLVVVPEAHADLEPELSYGLGSRLVHPRIAYDRHFARAYQGTRSRGLLLTLGLVG